MALLYLRKTRHGFAPADGPAFEIYKKFHMGEIYRANVVKPRSYQHHKLCMSLLSLTFENQDKYENFDMFRKAVAIEAGHVTEIIKLDGEIVFEPGSLAYDALDEVEFTKVFGAMMTVCARLLKGMGLSELEGEVSKYADQNYGRA